MQLGLPDNITAGLFDLDGVLTQTSKVHDAAWTVTFNDFLRSWSRQTGQPFVPFDPRHDYESYVDGRARADGVRTFLASRSITLPEGGPDEPPQAQTVHALAARKDAAFLEVLRRDGVKVYPGSVDFLRAARDAGLRRAVVSASANCAEVVSAAGIGDLLEVRVDGVVAAAQGLRGKPHPDTYLYAAQLLGVPAADAMVVEDALAGVRAGRDGGFGFVVGVDRVGQAEALAGQGATIVVRDLADLLRPDSP